MQNTTNVSVQERGTEKSVADFVTFATACVVPHMVARWGASEEQAAAIQTRLETVYFAVTHREDNEVLHFFRSASRNSNERVHFLCTVLASPEGVTLLDVLGLELDNQYKVAKILTVNEEYERLQIGRELWKYQSEELAAIFGMTFTKNPEDDAPF